MTKGQAAQELVREGMKLARMKQGTTASAKRVVAACKVLGLSDTEIRDTMAWLDYCDAETGEPYRPLAIKRVWP